jgi:hypothetical protein
MSAKYLNSILSKEPTAQPYLAPKLAMTPQPIETAPKENGERLLVFDEDWYIGWWHVQWGWQTYESMGHGEYDVISLSPTHWLPMPERPE